jgi:hypothetical protein
MVLKINFGSKLYRPSSTKPVFECDVTFLSPDRVELQPKCGRRLRIRTFVLQFLRSDGTRDRGRYWILFKRRLPVDPRANVCVCLF